MHVQVQGRAWAELQVRLSALDLLVLGIIEMGVDHLCMGMCRFLDFFSSNHQDPP